MDEKANDQSGDKKLRLLIDRTGRKYLLPTGSELHTNYGKIEAQDIESAKDGEFVCTNTGERFYVIEPDMIDFSQKAKRMPQTISIKDSALIAGYAGIKSGSRVVEAGVGSGVHSIFIANIIYPEILTGYEIREDFLKVAQKNFIKFNIKNIEIKLKNIYEGIDEKNLDLISLDLPEPWLVVPHAVGALKIGGYIASYCPSIEQSKKFSDELIKSDARFMCETFECILRNWDMKVVRPHSRMLAHTGFITVARMIGKGEKIE